MAIFMIHEEPIHTYYKTIIEFDLLSRKSITDSKTVLAINLNIILSSTCLIEGVLEDRAKLLLGYYRELYNTLDITDIEIRKPMNTFYNKFEEFLNSRISQTSGLGNYCELFELLTDDSIKKDNDIRPLIEGINVLFQ